MTGRMKDLQVIWMYRVFGSHPRMRPQNLRGGSLAKKGVIREPVTTTPIMINSIQIAKTFTT
jgi:hypothetical protein